MSSFRRFLSRPFGWLIAVAGFLCLAVPLAWATLAIYYSNLPWAGVRIGLAAAFQAIEANGCQREREVSRHAGRRSGIEGEDSGLPSETVIQLPSPYGRLSRLSNLRYSYLIERGNNVWI